MLAGDPGPVPGGGGRTLNVKGDGGEVAGDMKQPVGGGFYDSRLEEDLVMHSVDEFEKKSLASSGR